MRFRARVAAITCIAAMTFAAGNTSAQSFPFSTSFEPPEWTTGPAGQNGWSIFGTGSWTVVDDFARTGTQSVRWENTGIWLVSPDYGISGGTTSTTSVWVNIQPGASDTRRFGLQAFSAAGQSLGYTPAITFRADGQVWAQTTSTTQTFTGVTIANPTNRWIEVSLQMTLEQGGSVFGSVDGQMINMFALTGADPGLGSVDLYSTGTGNAVAFFDDYSAIPEPTSLAILGLIGMGFIARRRRRG